MSDLRLSGVAARVPGEKRRASALVMLVLCLSAPGAFAYDFRKPITIDRSKISDASCGATLASYPMLFSVTDLDLRSTGSGGKVTDPEGDDIIFKGLDAATCGGPLSCVLDLEIEKYVNTTGELKYFYELATVVFIGKSLTAEGGQNPVEPASYGCPVVFGPNMQNFEAISAAFVEYQAAVRVGNASELEWVLDELLGNDVLRKELGQRALQVIRRNQGALERTVELVLNQLRGRDVLISP